MPVQFTTLGSGSSGNAAFLSANGFGLLIDCGLGPRVLSDRLAAAGARWPNVSAVILTHLHGDHWKGLTLQQLQRLHVPLIVHPTHAAWLAERSLEFPGLQKAGLVRTYRDGEPLALTPQLHCLPVRVPHDSDPTFAFRFDGTDPDTGHAWSLGYASDLGHVPKSLATAFRAVDVLALEFNHDVELQRRSRRTQQLIARVLGTHGHLSNVQAAEFVQELLLNRTTPLQALFQLHLSRECNTAPLAQAAAQLVLADLSPTTQLITATQDRPTPTIVVKCRPAEAPAPPLSARSRVPFQPCLPGMA
ncbi:MBL fold metallo-hydrolase [Limnoglobus roseus]|uniref:MBL fold metallo-hydrolase n=1 Tax=Limnoglobus roseus TaxID=2598579 RepID=A0A5C1AC65_9BACT|nr:MBL fold metallo-hydrolase [Limnoglobus roseus]QEL16871.1 MBL fold metallo-hydrolase [Limnoglobus roseus]